MCASKPAAAHLPAFGLEQQAQRVDGVRVVVTEQDTTRRWPIGLYFAQRKSKRHRLA